MRNLNNSAEEDSFWIFELQFWPLDYKDIAHVGEIKKFASQ